MKHLTLALDVMGGDFGPRITIPAIAQALKNHSRLTVLLFGDQTQSQPFLKHFSDEQLARTQFIHTTHTIDNNVPFTTALRQSKGSSMRLALEAVKNGEAEGCVSGGNTGALMGLAKLLIEPLAQIDRPALTSLIPTMNGKSSVMLDLGANVEADRQLLTQFTEMGNIFAQAMLGLVFPRINLLNIGTEDSKGTHILRETHQQLKTRLDLNYQGFIESDKLMNHLTDVIVCDGFSGNMALKALEGAAKNILTLLKPSEDSSLCRNSKRLLLKLFFFRYFKKLQEINPDRHNGATLLGLSKVVVKSHGGASANAFYYAIEFALSQIANDIPQKIQTGLERLSV